MDGNRLRFFFMILIAGTAIYANEYDSSSVADSLFLQHEQPDINRRNPIVTGALSAAVPGAGQLYTGQYLKAGAFLAFEVITGSVAIFWRGAYEYRLSGAEEYAQTARSVSSWSDRVLLLEHATISRFDATSARYSMYNALSWMVGGYVWNILSALEASGHFISDSEKSPSVAAWLSAVPALGLGQIYNGSISKAGMVMMVQSSLGVLAINDHRLMKNAEERLIAIKQLRDSSGATPVAGAYSRDWESRRSTAFRNRNQWLWYSLFFYVYGILDAVVDAHLHDYPRKMRAYPDLLPERKAAGISIDYQF